MSKKEFKGTRGFWEVNKRASLNVMCNGNCVSSCGNGFDSSNGNYERQIENAKLIADAGNVRQQIEFDLPELLDRYRHMNALLSKIAQEATEDNLSSKDYYELSSSWVYEIDELLKNQ